MGLEQANSPHATENRSKERKSLLQRFVAKIMISRGRIKCKLSKWFRKKKKSIKPFFIFSLISELFYGGGIDTHTKNSQEKIDALLLS